MAERIATAVMLVAALAACGKSADENKAAPPPAEKTPAAKKTPAAERRPAAPPDAGPAAGGPRHWVEASAGAALSRMLKQVRPRVLGVGEVHVVAGGPAVRSALSRFTGDMLSVLDKRATDVVVETWVTDGKCGKAEKQVTANVRATTERPPETESEIGMLLRRAAEMHMRPRLMTMRCKQYQELRSKSGEVDYDRLLQLIGSELYRNVRAVLDAHPDATVVVYGGALHNDRQPNEGVAAYSYGVVLAGELGDGYVEHDLYVPELIAGDQLLAAEPWYPLVERLSGPGKVLLIERAPGSYILVLQPGVSR